MFTSGWSWFLPTRKKLIKCLIAIGLHFISSLHFRTGFFFFKHAKDLFGCYVNLVSLQICSKDEDDTCCTNQWRKNIWKKDQTWRLFIAYIYTDRAGVRRTVITRGCVIFFLGGEDDHQYVPACSYLSQRLKFQPICISHATFQHTDGRI